MTGEAASVGEVAGPTTEPAGRPRGDLWGALALHVLLAWFTMSLALLPYGEGLPGAQTLVLLAWIAAIWLALAAVIVYWWSRGRANLWELPLSWLALFSLPLYIVPLSFWPRFRRWVIRSALPWPVWKPTESESRARVAGQITGLALVAPVFYFLLFVPLLVMDLMEMIDEPTYAWGDVSFSHPGAFHESGAAETNPPAEEIEAVFLSYRGSDNGILFQVLKWDLPAELAGASDIPDAEMEDLAEAWGGGFAHRHIGGLPALVVTTPTPGRSYSGAKIWKAGATIFDVDAELRYVVICQYEDLHRRAIEDGCDKVLSTFEVNR